MPSPVDPRNLLPSRADPEQRKARKQLEKEHAVGLTEVAVLGLIGLTLAWDIDKQVKKREEKKDKEEAEQKKREERERRRREQAFHDGTFEPRRDYMASDSSRRSAAGSHARESRRQSADYRDDARFDDRYRDREPRYDSRDSRRYASPYDDARAYEGRSRRDSW